MKRIATLLLISIALLSSACFINSCSCACANHIDVQPTNYSTKEAVKDTKDWLAKTYTKGDPKIVDKYLKYQIVHADTNSPCFVRYTMHNISSRDLLVFKDGRVIVIDDDTKDNVTGYNYLFPFDITNVTNSQLSRIPKMIHN